MTKTIRTGVTRRRLLTTAGALALAGPMLRLGAGPAAAQGATPVAGGTLRYIISAEPAALTLGRASGANLAITSKIREGLVSYDLDQNTAPALATSWEVSEDGLTYTFHLREGVTWHDGAPFTAADVVFSLEYQKAVNNSIFQNLDTVTAADDLTAVLSLSAPAPYLLSLLAPHTAPIIPAHAYEGLDTAGVGASEALIGTGPFTFTEWERGSHVILDRNPNYWDAPKPYLDRIIIPFIADGQSRAAALEVGEVDIGSETPIPRSDVERLAELPEIEIEERGYDRAPLVVYVGFNFMHDQLKQVEVRRAIAHAIDKQRVLDTVWFGRGVVTENLIPPQHKDFYEPDVRTYPHDIAAANAILDEAGIAPGADGWRFSIRLDYFPQEDVKRFADYVKSTLSEIGIDVQIRTQDQAGYLKSIWTDYDFDAYILPPNLDADPAYAMPRPIATDKIVQGVSFYNAGRYSNPEVDRLIAEGASANVLEERRAIYSDLQKLLAEELPVLPVLVRGNVTIANRRVKDHTVDANGVAKGNLASAWLEG